MKPRKQLSLANPSNNFFFFVYRKISFPKDGERREHSVVESIIATGLSYWRAERTTNTRFMQQHEPGQQTAPVSYAREYNGS